MPRPGNTPLLFFAPRYLMDLATRPERSWLVQQLSGEWFGLRPGRGRPSPSSRFVTWLIYLPGWGAADWFSN